MGTQRQPGVRVVLDDLPALCHGSQRDYRLLQFGHALRLALGGSSPQFQWFVPECLDVPESLLRSSLRPGRNASASASFTRDAVGTPERRHMSSALSNGSAPLATTILAASLRGNPFTTLMPRRTAKRSLFSMGSRVQSHLDELTQTGLTSTPWLRASWTIWATE